MNSLDGFQKLEAVNDDECTCDMCIPQCSVKQERTMYVNINTPNNTHDEKLEHLLIRLNQVTYSHKEKLAKHFNTRETYPDDDKEAQKWFDEKNFCLSDGCSLRWGKKPDFEAFYETMDKVYDAKARAEDIIRVKTDEDIRLKALYDFESTTFH